ncbi:MAG: DUF2284 domain-containing protein [Deltaproteobacteria bacterium]|jgi:predicted metal-binding protein|nr:DUF2284 domain-containing protein [Deltaproteobacteria bacterium]
MLDLDGREDASAQNCLERELVNCCAVVGVDEAVMIDVNRIVFRPEFRELCEQNRCGNYDKNWRCPPKCGDIHELIDALKKKERAMVFTFVGKLKNPYDLDGMTKAGLSFAKVCQGVFEQARNLYAVMEAADKKPTVLGAGPCKNCEKCAILTKTPCRHPEEAVTSLEACGVDVGQLAKLSGLKYNAGSGTITYFGAVFI